MCNNIKYSKLNATTRDLNQINYYTSPVSTIEILAPAILLDDINRHVIRSFKCPRFGCMRAEDDKIAIASDFNKSVCRLPILYYLIVWHSNCMLIQHSDAIYLLYYNHCRSSKNHVQVINNII